MDVATETKTSATLVPVSAPTSTFHLVVIPANIATSIPYRQYCFAYHMVLPLLIVALLLVSLCVMHMRCGAPTTHESPLAPKGWF